jgi:hypothetical protein
MNMDEQNEQQIVTEQKELTEPKKLTDHIGCVTPD